MFAKRILLLSIITFVFGSLSAQKKRNKNTEKELSQEEMFVQNNFPLYSPSKWKPGERFLYTNSEIGIILNPVQPTANDTTDYMNKQFVFSSFENETDWLGKSTLNLLFKVDDHSYIYKTGRSL